MTESTIVSQWVPKGFTEAIVATFRKRFDEEEEVLFAQLLDPVTHQCAPYNVLDALTTSGDGWTDVCPANLDARFQHPVTFSGHNCVIGCRRQTSTVAASSVAAGKFRHPLSAPRRLYNCVLGCRRQTSTAVLAVTVKG